MINFKDDANLGFTELYKEANNITEPVVVDQISKKAAYSDPLEEVKPEGICTNE